MGAKKIMAAILPVLLTGMDSGCGQKEIDIIQGTIKLDVSYEKK